MKTISNKIGLFALRRICKGDDSLRNVREFEEFLLDSKESVNNKEDKEDKEDCD